jgi:hypothetical protein
LPNSRATDCIMEIMRIARQSARMASFVVIKSFQTLRICTPSLRSTLAIGSIVADDFSSSAIAARKIGEGPPSDVADEKYSEHEFCTAVETAFMQWILTECRSACARHVRTLASGRDYQPSGAGFGGGPSQSIEFVSVGCVRLGKQNGLP